MSLKMHNHLIDGSQSMRYFVLYDFVHLCVCLLVAIRLEAGIPSLDSIMIPTKRGGSSWSHDGSLAAYKQ